jgi:short-subunit dehydrogenase
VRTVNNRNLLHHPPPTVILVGRRQGVLDEAAKELQGAVAGTKYIGRAVDPTDDATVDAFWDGLATDGVHVDALVQCSGIFGQAKPLLELGLEGLGSMMASNFKGPIHMALRFGSQAGGDDKDKQKFFVYVSTNAVNLAEHN